MSPRNFCKVSFGSRGFTATASSDMEGLVGDLLCEFSLLRASSVFHFVPIILAVIDSVYLMFYVFLRTQSHDFTIEITKYFQFPLKLLKNYS